MLEINTFWYYDEIQTLLEHTNSEFSIIYGLIMLLFIVTSDADFVLKLCKNTANNFQTKKIL